MTRLLIVAPEFDLLNNEDQFLDWYGAQESTDTVFDVEFADAENPIRGYIEYFVPTLILILLNDPTQLQKIYQEILQAEQDLQIPELNVCVVTHSILVNPAQGFVYGVPAGRGFATLQEPSTGAKN